MGAGGAGFGALPGGQTMGNNTRRGVVAFFVLALSLSWAVWIPLALTRVDVGHSPWRYLMMLGGVSPSLFGLAFTIRSRSHGGRQFVRALFSPKLIGARNFGLMSLSLLIPFALSLAFDYVVTGNVPSTQRFSSGLGSPLSAAFVLLSLVYAGPLTEEFGWRGFATRELLPRLGSLKVSIVVGTIWSVWHYPLLFLNGQYEITNYFIFIPVHLIKHVGLAGIMTYFFARTKCSILSAITIHFLSNTLAIDQCISKAI
jgi:membrane protease YdiL (CAAX protease family)